MPWFVPTQTAHSPSHPDFVQMMLTGAATKLESQFRLKWNMILNLLRVEDM